MAYCYLGWKAAPEMHLPDAYTPATSITIIIPARNESANIRSSITSVLSQNYPQQFLEVIVVDDHSEDDTAAIATAAGGGRVNVIRLSEQPDPSGMYKKKTIEVAVAHATGQLIVTTDADCTAGPDWLRSIACLYETHHPRLIAGPVIFQPARSLFERFQALDFAGMMAITAATIHRGFYVMCNGANLAYERETFLELGGYRGADRHPSGDDMMLLHKVSERYPGQVAFAKTPSAVVMTPPIPALGDFLQQRFRWTSKSSGYSDRRVSAVLALVFLFNVSLLIASVGAFFRQELICWLLPVWLLKLAADYLVLRAGAVFFGQGRLLRTFFPSQVMHVLYIVFVGTLGNILPYRWKGRKVNIRR